MTFALRATTLYGVKVATSQTQLNAYQADASGECIFVPTMGALHEGHASLIRFAASLSRQAPPGGGGCIVSIFVNPTQFDDKADFARYPRTIDDDLLLCERAGAACVYAPQVGEVYPPGGGLPLAALPRVATAPGLEDAARPGHFAGVCQVVRRLFELVRPAAAVFGEKDWQQLRVIQAMVRLEGLAIRVVAMPTFREHDGLAMSSRNRFLSADDRRKGLALSRALCVANACATPREAEAMMGRVLAGAGIVPDYAVVREAAGLEPAESAGEWRALIAARIGPVRLIDNARWVSQG